jgi:hypothetical protein
MSISSILLAVFLVVFGAVYAFGLNFRYENLVVGVIAIAAGILIVARK